MRRITYHEKGNTLDCDVDEEEAKSGEVVRNVHCSPLHMVCCDLLILIGATLRNQSLRGNHAFSLIKEPAFLGASWHQEWRTETDEDSEKTLKKEDVAPSIDARSGNAPCRDSSKTAKREPNQLRNMSIVAYPVAKRPPKAPAMEAAET